MLTDFVKKESAIRLRGQGKSYREIEKVLGVNKSTLSGWLKNIKLTKKQKNTLHKKWLSALIKARKKSAITHIKQRQDKQQVIRQEVEDFTSDIKIDKKNGELILATFYLAEGTKKESCFALANSNPEVLKSIINLLRYLYKIDESKFRCCLHLRKDQDEKSAKKFWSKNLDINLDRFLKTQFDKRTVKKTYIHYRGVCVLYYYDMAVQRRILYLGEKIVNLVNNTGD